MNWRRGREGREDLEDVGGGRGSGSIEIAIWRAPHVDHCPNISPTRPPPQPSTNAMLPVPDRRTFCLCSWGTELARAVLGHESWMCREGGRGLEGG